MMMPLPGHIHEEKMIEMIHPDKDMDGLTTVNAGRLFSGKDGLFGGTPRAVMQCDWKAGRHDAYAKNCYCDN